MNTRKVNWLTWQRTARNRKWQKIVRLTIFRNFCWIDNSLWTSVIINMTKNCEKSQLGQKIVRLAIFRNTRKIAIFAATCEPGHKWDSNPWPLWYRCSAPVINWKSAALVSQTSRIRIPYKPEFFLGFLFAAANVAYITCDDLPSFNSSLRSSHIWFSYIHNFITLPIIESQGQQE